MTKTFTITLSDAEEKALSVVALSPQDWIQNAASERARLSIEEIVASEVQKKLANNESIVGSKEDIVLAADVETAAELKVRTDAEFAARG